MIWLVDGPDGSGKTTLCNYIAAINNAKVIHMVKPTTREEYEQQFNLYMNILKEESNIVFDRFWLSDLIYSHIMKDRPGMPVLSHDDSKKLFEVVNGKAICIHCNSDIETLWKRCCERGEDYVNFEQLLRIRQAYIDEFSEVTEIPVLEYEYRADKEDRNMNPVYGGRNENRY